MRTIQQDEAEHAKKKKKLNCLRKKNVDEELLHVDAATYVNKHVYIV